MFATKVLRQASAAAAHSERTPLIRFMGKRSIPSSIDHSARPHPASPSHELPAGFAEAQKSSSFSSYRQKAQQHGPLGRGASNDGTIGSLSGRALGSVAPNKGEYFDRNELPARFRRIPIDLAEIDAIETGGATVVC
ncbi:hypothetical protein SS1G_03955 [Sclerotinia sclerotiorum 1980 UF-70]|uniref:Ribosomal protein YMR-31 n=2 Tax=Sclerotinia sclerotiorum (strain ATCC 18683 / 1980 / Ss-1) TaxID=665079 RepID=A7EF64_SCLS1|nr:hypothetical protein SS1G_03955 [Sclerotinia sclerotiorum 1980 UF-70]APA12447.1 hypothetical protein sscle_09g072170 [Sclerotinia sclerotiorum 1980 UF-70]EDO01480.1 hypothetical protein SS1G_03955 [Sclerotinia sclerotiorum 1980 UF-70]